MAAHTPLRSGDSLSCGAGQQRAAPPGEETRSPAPVDIPAGPAASVGL